MLKACLRRDRQGLKSPCCGLAPGFSFPWIRFADCSWPGFLLTVRGNRRKFLDGHGAGVPLARLLPGVFFLRRMGPLVADLFRWHRDNSAQNPLLVAWPPLGI